MEKIALGCERCYFGGRLEAKLTCACMVLMMVAVIAISFTRKNIIKQFEAIESLLPVGPKERIVFTFVAIRSNGICPCTTKCVHTLQTL